MRIFLGLFAMTMALAAMPGLAQGTAQQRAACEADAHRFCDAYIPDAIAVERCLAANGPRLSTACKAEFGIASRGKGKRRK